MLQVNSSKKDPSFAVIGVGTHFPKYHTRSRCYKNKTNRLGKVEYAQNGPYNPISGSVCVNHSIFETTGIYCIMTSSLRTPLNSQNNSG